MNTELKLSRYQDRAGVHDRRRGEYLITAKTDKFNNKVMYFVSYNIYNANTNLVNRLRSDAYAT